jgi:hypothetical protein
MVSRNVWDVPAPPRTAVKHCDDHGLTGGNAKTRTGSGLQGNGGTQIRTGDTTIFSRVLYQLSYPAEARER